MKLHLDCWNRAPFAEEVLAYNEILSAEVSLSVYDGESAPRATFLNPELLLAFPPEFYSGVVAGTLANGFYDAFRGGFEVLWSSIRSKRTHLVTARDVEEVSPELQIEVHLERSKSLKFRCIGQPTSDQIVKLAAEAIQCVRDEDMPSELGYVATPNIGVGEWLVEEQMSYLKRYQAEQKQI